MLMSRAGRLCWFKTAWNLGALSSGLPPLSCQRYPRPLLCDHRPLLMPRILFRDNAVLLDQSCPLGVPWVSRIRITRMRRSADLHTVQTSVRPKSSLPLPHFTSHYPPEPLVGSKVKVEPLLSVPVPKVPIGLIPNIPHQTRKHIIRLYIANQPIQKRIIVRPIPTIPWPDIRAIPIVHTPEIMRQEDEFPTGSSDLLVVFEGGGESTRVFVPIPSSVWS